MIKALAPLMVSGVFSNWPNLAVGVARRPESTNYPITSFSVINSGVGRHRVVSRQKCRTGRRIAANHINRVSYRAGRSGGIECEQRYRGASYATSAEYIGRSANYCRAAAVNCAYEATLVLVFS
jgi:hypothetical protein